MFCTSFLLAQISHHFVLAAGLQFQVYQNNPVQTVEDGFFPERKRLRLPGKAFPSILTALFFQIVSFIWKVILHLENKQVLQNLLFGFFSADSFYPLYKYEMVISYLDSQIRKIYLFTFWVLGSTVWTALPFWYGTTAALATVRTLDFWAVSIVRFADMSGLILLSGWSTWTKIL